MYRSILREGRLSDIEMEMGVRFTFGLKMYSSAWRLKHEGILMTAMRYSINYFWTTFRERPFTTEHVDIREEPKGGFDGLIMGWQ